VLVSVTTGIFSRITSTSSGPVLQGICGLAETVCDFILGSIVGVKISYKKKQWRPPSKKKKERKKKPKPEEHLLSE
jgi:hypothetical protein